jgi:nucleoside-diphosphate-sugar epimerase
MARKVPVFIAGGTGYIGFPLIRALLERGHQVRSAGAPEKREKAACRM